MVNTQVHVCVGVLKQFKFYEWIWMKQRKLRNESKKKSYWGD